VSWSARNEGAGEIAPSLISGETDLITQRLAHAQNGFNG
jgi:hypothetical protein